MIQPISKHAPRNRDTEIRRQALVSDDAPRSRMLSYAYKGYVLARRYDLGMRNKQTDMETVKSYLKMPLSSSQLPGQQALRSWKS